MVGLSENWFSVKSDQVCEECGHRTFITGTGGRELKLRCEENDCSCYPMCSLIVQISWGVEGEHRWRLPDGKEFVYECPNCGSRDIEVTPYDDGMGYWNVRLVCEDCGESTWH